MSITMKELADLCGVSRTTIHRALNGTGRINPETREMILRVANEKGFRQNLLATGLAKGKTYNIGVVVLDVQNRYFAKMLSVISQESFEKGYGVNITLHDDNMNKERQQLNRLADYSVDGIILSSVNEGDEYVEFLKKLHIPVVTVDNKIDESLPFVGIDQKKAIADAVDKIAKNGYDRIVFVCPPLGNNTGHNLFVHKQRLLGFEEAMAGNSNIIPEMEISSDYLNEVKKYTMDGVRTAFLCTSDEYALEIMKYLRGEDKVPSRDYGIMGFDNIDTLDFLVPRLNTISNSVDEVARKAVELLFKLIEDNEDVEKQILIPHELVDGETI